MAYEAGFPIRVEVGAAGGAGDVLAKDEDQASADARSAVTSLLLPAETQKPSRRVQGLLLSEPNEHLAATGAVPLRAGSERRERRAPGVQGRAPGAMDRPL